MGATTGDEGHRKAEGEVGAGPTSKLRNNRRQSLSLEWSMSLVGTPPSHSLDKPHGLVSSNNNNSNNDNNNNNNNNNLSQFGYHELVGYGLKTIFYLHLSKNIGFNLVLA